MRRPFDILALRQNIEVTLPLRISVWLISVLVAIGLGFLRVLTGAEYAFVSAVILPLLVVAWIGGRREGMFFSALASLMWTAADLLAGLSFSATWIPILNGLTRFAVYILIVCLIAALREMLQREQRLARRDALTGLLNRRAFFEIGQEETERARRYGHALGIAFLDLDDFKRLNDTQGHEAGDYALIAVADVLTGFLRVSDRVARLGGDEFAVILPEATFAAATDTGSKLANEIRRALQNYPPVSVSVGIAWFERAAADFDEMLNAADALMYEIKVTGKHGVQCKHFSANEQAPHEFEAR